MSSYYLGIDCGGTTIKSGIYDENSREVGSSRRNLHLISPNPGWSERDTTELRDQCFETIRDVIASSAVDPALIKGIAISAQGKGLFGVDKAGRPLPTGILSADRRAIEVVRQWEKENMREKIYPRTRQTLWTGHPVSILRFLKEHDRERYDRLDCIMMSHDYLRYCLTGEKACERTNISESNLFNMKENRFDSTLAADLGIEECMDKLPRIVGSTDICGEVTKEAAAMTGLIAGTPVAGGIFDVAAGAVAAGLHDDSALNICMGTWAVATGITTEVSNDEHPFVYGRHASEGQYIVHEASPTSSGNMEWICTNLKEKDFGKINAAVASLPKAYSDVYFIPFLYGSNASLDSTAGFYGLQSIHTRADLFQACFEGVIFAQMKHVNSIRRKFPKADRLIVTGGSTHSQVWMQILADTAQMPVCLPRIEETGCLGAALLAQVATGLHGSVAEAQAAMPIETRLVEPDPAAAAIYGEKFARYTELVNCLSLFHERVGQRKYC